MRPHLLLTNDDGIQAPGLRALAAGLREVADLTIVAPSQENSGMGHAITVFRDLHFAPVHEDGRLWGWGLNGTPADCVKVAIHLLGRDRPFDAVISGINPGQNAGINVLYSGTVAAAREAAIYGLPAMAVSLLYHDRNDLPWATPARVAAEVFAKMRAHPLPRGTMLNVNVPPVPYEQLAGWSVTRMGDSGYSDFFELRGEAAELANQEALPLQQPGVGQQMDAAPRNPAVVELAAGSSIPAAQHPADPTVTFVSRAVSTPAMPAPGPAIFRNIGNGWNQSTDHGPDVDDHALYANRVSITPLQFDLTAYAVLDELQAWFG